MIYMLAHDIRSTLIYDACQSGSFIPLLASQDDTNRLVITSSAEKQNAWFASDGYLSFSYYFWTIFRSGGDFSEATVAAKNAMGFQFAQTAKFDANGNGISDEKTDKLAIKEFSFGQGAVQASEFPCCGCNRGSTRTQWRVVSANHRGFRRGWNSH